MNAKRDLEQKEKYDGGFEGLRTRIFILIRMYNVG